ncbi:hypothetical protein AB0M39_13225 [Streptomyces sp. NPDC051907]|uniref:hypothetical protein n=1 Tax=Streptomyces sp. NPDC051907 TaxID=3155284 RepID=UPI003418052D
MGIKDQSEDKGGELGQRTRKPSGGTPSEVAERSAKAAREQAKRELQHEKTTEEAMREAEDRFNQDYDV